METRLHSYTFNQARLSSPSAPPRHSIAAASQPTQVSTNLAVSPPPRPKSDKPPAHILFDSKSVKTAKCDQCNRRNQHVIQRCQLCNVQLCKPCLHNPESDGRHRDMGDCNWIDYICGDYYAWRNNRRPSQRLKGETLKVAAASPNSTKVQKRKRSLEKPAESPEAASVKKQKNSLRDPATLKPKRKTVHFPITPVTEIWGPKSLFVSKYEPEKDSDDGVSQDKTEDGTSNLTIQNFEPSRRLVTEACAPSVTDSLSNPDSISNDASHIEEAQEKKDRPTSSGRDGEVSLISNWRKRQHHRDMREANSARLRKCKYQRDGLPRQIRETTEGNGANFSSEKKAELWKRRSKTP